MGKSQLGIMHYPVSRRMRRGFLVFAERDKFSVLVFGICDFSSSRGGEAAGLPRGLPRKETDCSAVTCNSRDLVQAQRTIFTCTGQNSQSSSDLASMAHRTVEREAASLTTYIMNCVLCIIPFSPSDTYTRQFLCWITRQNFF